MIQRIMRKPMIYATAKDTAVITNEMAKQSNTLALELMETGIRSNVTAKDVKKATNQFNIFNGKGFMTNEGRKILLETLKMTFGISEKQAKKITVADYMSRILSSYTKEDANLHAAKLGFNA